MLPAHDSVRDFIFSDSAFAAIAQLKTPHEHKTGSSTYLDAAFETIILPHGGCRKAVDESAQKARQRMAMLCLGRACLLQIEQNATRAMTSVTAEANEHSRISVPTMTAQWPVLVQRHMQLIWPYTSKNKTWAASVPLRHQETPTTKSPLLSYAIKNWVPCDRGLSDMGFTPDSGLDQTIRGSTTAQKHVHSFCSIALDRNESWNIHPWPALVQSQSQHIAGMFAFAVANNHIPLLELAIGQKGLLPRGIYSGLLPNHEYLPALHVACQLGHSEVTRCLLETDVCKQLVICHRGRTALHYAAEGGHANCVRLLLAETSRRSSLLDVPDGGRDTALHLTLKNAHQDVAVSLVRDYRSNISQVDGEGRSPAGIALDGGWTGYCLW